FSADLGARAAVEVAYDGAEPAAGRGFGVGLLPDGPGLGELAADVDVDHLGLDGMRRDGDAFEQRVRRPAHDLAVLERSRLGFVRVHAQVVRLLLLLGHEGPLEPRRETGTAPPA